MEHRGQSPTLKLGDACLLVPWGLILLFLQEESATKTSSEWEVNTGQSLHLLVGPPCDTTDDLNQGTLNWRSPNTEVGRAAPRWRVRSFLETRSFITMLTDSKQNPCLSLLPPSSPFTQMLSLCTQKPASTSLSALRAHVQSITQSTWLHFHIYPKSHHLTIIHCRHLRLSQQSREGTL